LLRKPFRHFGNSGINQAQECQLGNRRWAKRLISSIGGLIGSSVNNMRPAILQKALCIKEYQRLKKDGSSINNMGWTYQEIGRTKTLSPSEAWILLMLSGLAKFG